MPGLFTVTNLKGPRVTGELVRRMEALSFFDEEVTRDLLFLSVHDAILFIQLETSSGNEQDLLAEKVKLIAFICYRQKGVHKTNMTPS